MTINIFSSFGPTMSTKQAEKLAKMFTDQEEDGCKYIVRNVDATRSYIEMQDKNGKEIARM